MPRLNINENSKLSFAWCKEQLGLAIIYAFPHYFCGTFYIGGVSEPYLGPLALKGLRQFIATVVKIPKCLCVKYFYEYPSSLTLRNAFPIHLKGRMHTLIRVDAFPFAYSGVLMLWVICIRLRSETHSVSFQIAQKETEDSTSRATLADNGSIIKFITDFETWKS